jgi:hypothetical protein
MVNTPSTIARMPEPLGTAMTVSPTARDRVAEAAHTLRYAAVVVAVGAVLFFCYWRQSLSSPVSSDGASIVLQAWDMLHGNLLLHGWQLGDVSFYTTELPQYMLIAAIRGLNAGVVNVAAALTYTLVVLLAALLAKGRARGQEGLGRCLLAGGIMLTPQLGATPTFLQGPDHTGTAVPLLLAWLLIDRARPRWYVPAAVCLILAWTLAADSIVLVTGIAPLIAAAVARALRALARGTKPSRYELSLAGAAAVAVLGSAAPLIIRAAGGYQEAPAPERIAGIGHLPESMWVTFQAVLEAFGANVFSANPAIELAFVALHLVGAFLAGWALWVAVTQFFRASELLIPAFAVAIVLNLAAFWLTAQPVAATREIAAVLPLSAVLAGRLLAGRILRARLAPVLAVVAAGYLATLAYSAAQPAMPATNQGLATWLAAHHLSDGLAGYWQANSTTLDSGARITVNSVLVSQGRLVPYAWEISQQEYDPSRHYADFLVAHDAGSYTSASLQAAAEHTFGRPRQIYHLGRYTILTWQANILSDLGR